MTLLMFWWQSQTREIKNQRRYACVYLEGFILMVHSLWRLLFQSLLYFVTFSEKEIKYWQGFTSEAERVIFFFILCKHFLRQQQHRLWISRHSFPFLCQSLCERQQFTDSEPIILGYINGPLNAKTNTNIQNIFFGSVNTWQIKNITSRWPHFIFRLYSDKCWFCNKPTWLSSRPWMWVCTVPTEN